MINALPPDLLVQVLDALPVRIFWKDRQLRFLGCNRLFAEDAGLSDPNEMIGKSDFYFYHPDQAAAFRYDDAEVMFSGKPRLGLQERLTRADGKILWLETNKLPLRNADGAVIGVLGMYQDITTRKEMEEKRCAKCVLALARALP